MICHIVQNGGCIFLILCAWILIVSSATSGSSYTIQEFCSGNLFIRTIEPGEPYHLTLRSEGTSSSKNKWYQKTKRKCQKDFKTSDPAAHLEVLITNMTIPSCSGVNQTCRCNYFEVSVLGHKNRYCGDNETGYFSSKSDTITIEFHHYFPLRFDVTLKFTAERNSYIISGTPSEHSYSASTFLETPYFPISYPPNYRAEYTLQSSDVNGHVILLFLDFQISNESFIEVVGNNGSHPTRFYGSTFRPPVIVSQSNHLELKFESYNKFGMKGFRGLSYFVKTIDSLSVPYTDCGGLKDGRVGNMNIKTHERFSLYDCMWRYLSVMTLMSNISIFIQLRDISHKSMLEFRSGDNSKSDVIKLINCESESCSNLNLEITVPASDDLYIRFNGYLDVYSIVNMSYNTFHTRNCSDKEFMCEDGRCLLINFQCDGIKQCPSGIDEEQCPITMIPEVKVIANPTVKRENFYNTVYKKFFIIVLVGSFGLVAVFIAVCIFMYKYHKVINDNIEQAQTQHIIGEMSGVAPTLYPNNLYCNDNPPSYEDFIKSSECYPPLLYTRAKQRYMPKEMCTECTTSFTVSARPRYHSADSSSYRSSDTNSDMFTNNVSAPSEQACSNLCSVEIFNSGPCKTSNSIRKWYSLDSKLNDLAKEDTCHVFLSIIHPVCNHTSSRLTHVQCHTLPPNFKISSKYSGNIAKIEEAVCLPSNSNARGTKDRRCTWSFVPYNSNGCEVLTVVKPRCCSDPCKGIKVHCSLY